MFLLILSNNFRVINVFMILILLIMLIAIQCSGILCIGSDLFRLDCQKFLANDRNEFG